MNIPLPVLLPHGQGLYGNGEGAKNNDIEGDNMEDDSIEDDDTEDDDTEDDSMEDDDTEGDKDDKDNNTNDCGLENNDTQDNKDDDDDHAMVIMMGMYQQFMQYAALYLNQRSRNPPVPFLKFNIRDYNSEICERLFCFQADEIHDIVNALRIPDVLVLDNGSKFSSLEGVCMILRCLSFPCRFVDLVPMFGRSERKITRMFNATMTWIYRRWDPLLFGWDYARLTPAKLEEFAASIAAQGSPLPEVVGFLNGSIRPIGRLSEHRRWEYNDHCRAHVLKFQAVATPDGLIVHLSGPYNGNQHNSSIYRVSRLQDVLLQRVKNTAGNNMYLFGDQGHDLSPVLQVAFPMPDNQLSVGQRRYNMAIAKLRSLVEGSFGHKLQYFSYTELKTLQPSLLSSVHIQYSMCVLFANLHSCIRQSNATSSKFGVLPPSLDEYLHS